MNRRSFFASALVAVPSAIPTSRDPLSQTEAYTEAVHRFGQLAFVRCTTYSGKTWFEVGRVEIFGRSLTLGQSDIGWREAIAAIPSSQDIKPPIGG